MRRLAVALLLALVACVSDGSDRVAPSVQRVTADGVHTLSVGMPPAGLPFNEPFELEVVVSRVDGAPAGDLAVRPSGWMPDHGHGLVQHPRAEPVGGGRFRTHGWLLHMRGRWELRFDVVAADSDPRLDTSLQRASVEVVLP